VAVGAAAQAELQPRCPERLTAEGAGRAGTQRERPAGVVHPEFRPAQRAAGDRLQLPDGHDPPLVANEPEHAASIGALQIGEFRDAKAAMVAELAAGGKGVAERQNFGP
jgi:hypothetical protein